MQNKVNLSPIEKLIMRLFCYPPQGRITKNIENPERQCEESNLGTIFGENNFRKAVNGKVVMDIGCGNGEDVIQTALMGANKVLGVDIRNLFDTSQKKAEMLGISEKVNYSTKVLKEIPPGIIDVALSKNSFEHYDNPEEILLDVHRLLKPGGKFFITFGPPWFHPYGGHMSFMFKYPYPHLIFRERTVMKIRCLYKNDGASKYREVEGGLNKMTIRKFQQLLVKTGFRKEKIWLKPIRHLDIMTKLPIMREFFTSTVNAIIVKPGF